MGALPDAVRVLIVDDHASFSESLRDVLGRRPGITIIGTAPTAADGVRLAYATVGTGPPLVKAATAASISLPVVLPPFGR